MFTFYNVECQRAKCVNNLLLTVQITRCYYVQDHFSIKIEVCGYLSMHFCYFQSFEISIYCGLGLMFNSVDYKRVKSVLLIIMLSCPTDAMLIIKVSNNFYNLSRGY